MAAGHYSDFYLKQSLACKQHSWNQTAAGKRLMPCESKREEKVNGIRLDLNANQTQLCHSIDWGFEKKTAPNISSIQNAAG